MTGDVEKFLGKDFSNKSSSDADLICFNNGSLIAQLLEL